LAVESACAAAFVVLAIHLDAVVLDKGLIPKAQVVRLVGDACNMAVRDLNLSVRRIYSKHDPFSDIRTLLLSTRFIVELKRYLPK
jgi:hypothetical protein